MQNNKAEANKIKKIESYIACEGKCVSGGVEEPSDSVPHFWGALSTSRNHHADLFGYNSVFLAWKANGGYVASPTPALQEYLGSV